MTYWRQKRRTMKRYDSSAYVYDVQYQEEQEAKIRTALTEINLTRKDTIIDLGCGTGQLLPHILNSVKLVVCVDVSRNLLAQTKTRTQHRRQVVLLRADADNLPFQPHKLDVAFAITLLQNMPSPIRTLNEMKRVTREDGIFVVTGLKKCFSEQQFEQLLKQARFEINSLKLDEAQREYIAVCTSAKESLNRTPKPL